MERSIFIHRSIIVVMTDPSSASLSLQLLNNKNSYLFWYFLICIFLPGPHRFFWSVLTVFFSAFFGGPHSTRKKTDTVLG